MTLLNIEKLFDNEVKEKKKGLSGARNRASRLGYVGTIKWPSDFMSKKEKRRYKKPRKERKYNMYKDILSYKEFQTFDKETQKEILQKWREQHSNVKIYETMGINRTYYYNLLHELGIETNTKPNQFQKKTFTQQEMEAFKQKQYVDYQTILEMRADQQAEIFRVMDQNFNYNTNEIAKLWGISKASVYSLRSRLRKQENKQAKKDEPKMIAVTNAPQQQNELKESSYLRQIQMDTTPSNEKVVTSIDNHKKQSDTNKNNKRLELRGQYNAEQLANELEKMVRMIEGDNSEWSVNVSLKQTKEPTKYQMKSKNQEADPKVELLKQILNI